MLALPNFSQVFEIDLDAIRIKIGAILSQGGRSVVDFNEKFNGLRLNSSTYDKECYVVHALRIGVTTFVLLCLFFILIIKH